MYMAEFLPCSPETTPILLIGYIPIHIGYRYQTTWPASWEIYMQVRKQQLEVDMEQQTGSK